MVDNSLRQSAYNKKKHNADLRDITNEDRHGKDSDIKWANNSEQASC